MSCHEVDKILLPRGRKRAERSSFDFKEMQDQLHTPAYDLMESNFKNLENLIKNRMLFILVYEVFAI